MRRHVRLQDRGRAAGDVCVPDVSADFLRDGRMRRAGIVWFPPLWQQMAHFVRTGFLINYKDYMDTCLFYYGTTTFAEVTACDARFHHCQ